MSNPQESFVHTTIGVGSLIHARRRAVSRNTLLYQLEVLKKTGRYDAFNLKWHPSYSDPPDHWPIPNHLFWDSDVGKWIEGACYFLLDAEEKCAPEIQKAVDELVDMIESAQQPDGYLNIHYTAVAPGLRFTNLRDMHELYNCGHLIEAALAHHDLAGRDSISSSKLLNTMLKYVKLLCQLFGPDSNQIHGYPGHPEIELALLRLYKRTSDPEHLRLAQYFLTERGQSHGTFNQHFYTVESERRGEDPHAAPSFMGQHTAYWYHQAHLPIVDQPTIEGHSVRAMYLLTAAADLCSIAPRDLDTRLRPAIYRLWTSMVSTKMYVTGGIGAIKQWEGFGLPHFLPQSSDEGGCYAETCAAIGVVMLAERLLQIELDGSIADVMELAMYNALLVGMSDCGRKFAYHNQLASCETNPRGVLREEWFTCACCPPNVLRFLAMIGGYVYSRRAEPAKGEDLTIDVHLFISSSATWTVGDGRVVLKQESSYPWRGAIEFSVDASEKDTPVGLNIRIPAWAKDQWILSPAPASTLNPSKGYIHLSPTYLTANHTFTLHLPLQPRLLSQSPLSANPIVAIARGPLVYTAEDVDNTHLPGSVAQHFRDIHLDPASALQGVQERLVAGTEKGLEYLELTLTKGVHSIDYREGQMVSGPTWEVDKAGAVWGAKVTEVEKLVLVPFFYRANRDGGKGVARVGFRRWVG